MLALIMIIVFPSFYLLGRTVIGIAYGPAGRERFFLEDKVITGMVLMIGLAECAHIGAFVSGRSVCVSAKYFVLLFICVVAFCAIASFIRYLIGKKQKDHKNGSRPIFSAIHPERREIVFFAIWMLLLAWQLFTVLYQCRVFQEADVTLETVVSFLETDRLYEYNPLTGAPYQAGMPQRLQVLCLPTLYADLCLAAGVSPEFLVWHLVPALVVLLAHFAYYSIARCLFPEKRFSRIFFMVLVSFLLMITDSGEAADGFGLMHMGFHGTTLRSTVLLPYLFSLCLRRNWRLTIPLILAEICLVWTLYGLGVCIFVTIAMWLILHLITGRRMTPGKEELS